MNTALLKICLHEMLWNIGKAVEQEELSCDEVKTEKLTYLCDRVSADGGCEDAVIAKT